MSQKKAIDRSINGQVKLGQIVVNEDVRPKGRRYTREYKLRILAEADRCEHGEVGALLRREGLYTSTLSRWRQERETGKLAPTTGLDLPEKEIYCQEIARLKWENKQLRAKLAKAKTIIEVQKKLAVLLEQMQT